MAVLALAEVDLGERVDPGDPGDVDEVGDLDAVPGGKAEIAEVVGVRCDLAREGRPAEAARPRGVSISPGAKTLARMPRRAPSTATCRLSPMSPALLAS